MAVIMTVEELSAYLKVAVRTIYNWHSQGKIQGIKLGGLKFDKSDVDKLIEKMKENNGVHN